MQAVTLGGLDSPTFDHTIAAVEEIFDIFNREFKDGQLDTLDIVVHNKESGAKIKLSNQCLMPCKDAPDMEAIALGKDVDPHGILEALIRKGTHLHGEENRVLYYTVMEAGKGGQRYGMNTLNHGSLQ